MTPSEMENLQFFGQGAKAFTLSMIETALKLTNGQIRGTGIQKITELGKGMLEAPVRLLERSRGGSDSLQITRTHDHHQRRSAGARTEEGRLDSQPTVEGSP